MNFEMQAMDKKKKLEFKLVIWLSTITTHEARVK